MKIICSQCGSELSKSLDVDCGDATINRMFKDPTIAKHIRERGKGEYRRDIEHKLQIVHQQYLERTCKLRCILTKIDELDGK